MLFIILFSLFYFSFQNDAKKKENQEYLAQVKDNLNQDFVFNKNGKYEKINKNEKYSDASLEKDQNNENMKKLLISFGEIFKYSNVNLEFYANELLERLPFGFNFDLMTDKFNYITRTKLDDENIKPVNEAFQQMTVTILTIFINYLYYYDTEDITYNKKYLENNISFISQYCANNIIGKGLKMPTSFADRGFDMIEQNE